MFENELPYLLKTMPDLNGCSSAEIVQHYLSSESNLRIRATNGREFELTKKLRVSVAGEDDGTRKEEINIPLTESEYRAQLTLAKRGLEKTRWFFPIQDGLVAQINIYKGPLNGLVLIEVEFDSEEQRRAFLPPPWFGRCVAKEKWASNSKLAGKTFQEVQRHLG